MSTSGKNKEHDVFISFRGEDTRRNILSYLRHTLENNGIPPYTDNLLHKGKEVWSEIEKAIRDSHISIVIFSEKFATSAWCLDELLEILECRKSREQVLIPVFYGVEPTHVRKQTGPYAKAFARYKRNSKVPKWKKALTEAANICGWDSSVYKDDVQLVEEIVKDVNLKLTQMYPNELEGLFEIDRQSQHLESLLENFSRIGIWGMGGIGKTTLAMSIFAKHIAQYQSVCFLKNVREEIEKLGSTTSVCNKLLSELLKRQITTSNALRSTFIKKRLSALKVFIVLDDVEDATQLAELCKGLDSLGPDSRLIVTRRDKQILKKRVDRIYEVMPWDFPESLKFFSLAAFDQPYPEMGYEHLSERAVAYTGCVPLALKVLGLHFHSREIEVWEDQLRDFENREESCHKRVREVLQTSYSLLRRKEKAIFLDIAFFFKGEDKDFVIRILEACGFAPVSGIAILEEKALITISNRNKIQMHDLLQIMGLEIVREECSINTPGSRSRLKNIEEICYVLKKNKGTDAVEGITLDLSHRVDLQLSADTFNMMCRLRFLRLHVPLGKKKLANIDHPEVLEWRSDDLRYLEWNGYPMKSLPSKFCAKFLVEIRLPHSCVEELWQGIQDLVNLEAIDLSECKQLKKLPNLSGASKLKWVYLSGCESLCVFHLSHLSVDKLITLMLDRCKKLQSLTSEKHFKFLKEFNVDDCSSLEEFSLSSDLIERLDLSKTGVKKLHSTIGGLSKLAWLNLKGLRLENLPDELSHLTSLKDLRISYCVQVNKNKLQVLFEGLQFLEILHLMHCSQLSYLPDNINALSSLHELRLDGSSIRRLPASIKDLQKLEFLSLQNCKELQFLPELPSFIKDLIVINCPSLSSVSTMKNFSAQMKGKDKYISSKNGMKLNESSLIAIMDDAQVIMRSAAFHNVLVRMFSDRRHSYNYNSVVVCLPGSNVPWSITNQTIVQSSNLLGLIYCVVLSPPPGMVEQCGVIIECQCYTNDRSEVGNATAWHREPITELNSDNVFLWYDPYHYDSIIDCGDETLCFEFFVKTESGEPNDLISIKECGVHLIWNSESEFRSFLLELDLELNLKLDLGLRLGLAFDLEQGQGNYDDNWRLFLALEMRRDFDELDESSKLQLESRLRALSTLLGIQNQQIKVKDVYGFGTI